MPSFKKSIVVIFITIGLIGCLALSKETIYTMMVVDQITADNIKAIGDAGENVIDYITDKIDQIVNEKESK